MSAKLLSPMIKLCHMQSVVPGLALAASHLALPFAWQLFRPRLKLPSKQSEIGNIKVGSFFYPFVIAVKVVEQLGWLSSPDVTSPLSFSPGCPSDMVLCHGNPFVRVVLLSLFSFCLVCPSVTVIIHQRLSFCHGRSSVSVVLPPRQYFC